MTRVLIVEDEESFADPLAYLLRKEGFENSVAVDGPAALEDFERHGADIVLLDLMLPGMSGTDVCKALRQRSAVPVIMVTARDAELARLRDAAAYAASAGIEAHAGHALSFDNVAPVAAIAELAELNIGHFIVGEAISVGLEEAVRRMRAAMDAARPGSAGLKAAGTRAS